MFMITPTLFLVLGLLLLRWGYVVLDRGVLSGRGAVRLALVGLPGLYMANWVRGMITVPGLPDMIAYEAALFTLVFWTWVSVLALAVLIWDRAVQFARDPLAILAPLSVWLPRSDEKQKKCRQRHDEAKAPHGHTLTL